MVSEHEADQRLYQVMPAIQRARDYWLYSGSGRYFDMYLGEGRALYGHRPPQLSRIIKSYISKGLYAPYPHLLSHKITTTIRHHYQHRYNRELHVAIYATRSRALSALSDIAQKPLNVTELYDPARSPQKNSALLHPTIAFDRPLLKAPEADIVLPVTPLPLANAPQIVCASPQWRHALKSDAISPILLAAVQGSSITEHTSVNRERSRTTLQNSHRNDWVDPVALFKGGTSSAAPRLWHQEGTYLSWRGDTALYTALFSALLKEQVLIHPFSEGVTILPPICTQNDYLRFERVNAIVQQTHQ